MIALIPVRCCATKIITLCAGVQHIAVPRSSIGGHLLKLRLDDQNDLVAHWN